MITLIGMLLGFVSAVVPKVINIFEENKNRRHELSLADREIKLADINIKNKLNTSIIEASTSQTKAMYEFGSTATGNKFLDILRGSVRPLITYSFFFLFLFIKITYLNYLITLNTSVSLIANTIWDESTQTMFAAIISFWFGNRAINR